MTRVSDTNAVYGYDTLRRTPFVSYNNELYYTGNKLHKVIEHTSKCIDTCNCLTWSCNSYIDWKPEYFTMYYIYNDSLICVFNKEPEEYPAVFEYFYFKGLDLEYMQAHGAQKTERYRQIRSYLWHARKIVDTFHELIVDNKLNK